MQRGRHPQSVPGFEDLCDGAEKGSKRNNLKAKIKTLPVAAVRLDFQRAEDSIEETVQEYLDALNAGNHCHPCECGLMPKLLSSGRIPSCRSVRRLGIETIDAEISRCALPEMQAE